MNLFAHGGAETGGGAIATTKPTADTVIVVVDMSLAVVAPAADCVSYTVSPRKVSPVRDQDLPSVVPPGVCRVIVSVPENPCKISRSAPVVVTVGDVSDPVFVSDTSIGFVVPCPVIRCIAHAAVPTLPLSTVIDDPSDPSRIRHMTRKAHDVVTDCDWVTIDVHPELSAGIPTLRAR